MRLCRIISVQGHSSLPVLGARTSHGLPGSPLNNCTQTLIAASQPPRQPGGLWSWQSHGKGTSRGAEAPRSPYWVHTETFHPVLNHGRATQLPSRPAQGRGISILREQLPSPFRAAFCSRPAARQGLDHRGAQQGSPGPPSVPLAPYTRNPGAAPGSAADRAARPRRTVVPGTGVWGRA